MKEHLEVYLPLSESHPDYMGPEECQPDIRAQKIEDISLEHILDIGITDVLLDWDHTLVSNRQTSPDMAKLAKIDELLTSPHINSVHIATANRSDHIIYAMEQYTDWMQAEHGLMQVFQPFEAGALGLQHKWHSSFWRKILFEIDCLEQPERVLMVGDSIRQDVWHPQQEGMRGALVERYVSVRDYSGLSEELSGAAAMLLAREAERLYVDVDTLRRVSLEAQASTNVLQ